MKPIKPRPLSTRLLTRIKTLATFGPRSAQFDSKDARAILAALEHTKTLPDNWHARLSPPGGCSIDEACRVLCEFSQRRKQFATMEFNGLTISAWPGSNPADLVREYNAKHAARAKQ